MTTLLPAAPALETDRRLRPRPTRTSRPGVRPSAHPARAPRARRAIGTTPRFRACTVEREPSHLRLTDRGIAVVLLVGALVVTAALVVVGLTALTVTSPGYHLDGLSALSL